MQLWRICRCATTMFSNYIYILSNQDVSSSADSNGIHSILLKSCAEAVTTSILRLFNRSLDEGRLQFLIGVLPWYYSYSNLALSLVLLHKPSVTVIISR